MSNFIYVVLLEAPVSPPALLRLVSVRGEAVLTTLPEPARSAPAGTGWLLARTGTRWTEAHSLRLTPAEPQWPAIPDVVGCVPGHLVDTMMDCPLSGTWCRDAAGRAVEFGWVRDVAGAKRDLLSYVGWPLSALAGRELCLVDPGIRGWNGLILPPAAVGLSFHFAPARSERGEPREARSAPPRLLSFGADSSWTLISSAPGRPRPVLEDTWRAWERPIRLDELTFLLGQVEFRHAGATHRFACEGSIPGVETVKSVLASGYPETITVCGEGLGERVRNLRVEGLDRLREFFVPAWKQEQVRAIAADGSLQTIASIQNRLAEVCGHIEPEALLREAGFGLRQDRIAAFEHLFAVRHPDHPIHTRAMKSFVVPVRAVRGDGLLLAWEVAERDNATYLFAPADEPTLTALLVWISSQPSREDFLRDEARKTQLAFVGRVIHSGKDADLSAWKRDLANFVMSPPTAPAAAA